ncbi:PrsW family glutamic-type intramembrane protease [Actinomycetospora termitidis]|uniref:PrsW family glutamic-type intramembrane protease n=1 Tax=Actinomycetospora termitidis TaxID=3053470 RepID=A0ABT7ME35_9PSEU|nr:PrsW family glutamic-type intramembrane protease [Actinomycetospora sp. Odt1-22]MDL5158926.1 PrsW family glutamic-type intramembrane protease [Actinomycetospora sp. Odt1-22]
MTAPSSERLPDVGLLFPFRAWVRHPVVRAWTTWLFVGLALVPVLARFLTQDSGGTDQAWMFAAYFAAAWFGVLWMLVRPQAVSGGLLAVLCVAALVVEGPLAIVLERALDSDTDDLALSILTVGVPEEFAKLLPVVALALYVRRRGLAPRDALFLGAVSGLVFGAAEAVTYVTEYIPLVSGGGVDASLASVWRFVVGPLLHALWAGVSGYFVGLAAQYRRPGHIVALTAVGLGATALLHGVYDYAAGGFVAVLIVLVSVLLFLGYARIGLLGSPAPQQVPIVDPPTMPVALPSLASGGGLGVAGRHAR